MYFPSTCCLNYLLCGLDTDAVLPSHMNALLSAGTKSAACSLTLRHLGRLQLRSYLATRLVISFPSPMIPTHSGWWWVLIMTHSPNVPHFQKNRMAETEETVHVCLFTDFSCKHFQKKMHLSYFMMLNVRAKQTNTILVRKASSSKCDLPQAAMSACGKSQRNASLTCALPG